MTLLAPVQCTANYPAYCGATIRVREETWVGGEHRVFTATLVCDAGHEWLDMRDAHRTRPHPWLDGERRFIPLAEFEQQHLPFPQRSRR